MIKLPTVLVLGAGSSAMYGFPLGPRLRRLIVDRFQGLSAQLLTEYDHMGFNPEAVEEFGESILKSGVSSVDAFLEHRVEFMEIGKTAIAEALIPFEEESTLFNAATDWYGYLLDKLNAPFGQFHKNRLTVITFNYDRSLEWYFYTALRSRFGLTEDNAEEHMRSVPIVHLYGTLGGSPWNRHNRPYIGKSDRQNIYKARQAIKIIHESERNEEEFRQALVALRMAERICFLGFGYNRINTQRLEPNQWVNCHHPLKGTAYGMTELEKQEARGILEHSIDFGEHDWDVLRFLREMVTLDEQDA